MTEENSFYQLLHSPNPQVSVVIPTYNKSQYLLEAVQSILDQSHKNTEIIVVNDGSTDDTKQILTGFVQQHGLDQIRLLDKENGGVSDARNFGLEAATSEVVLILDSDDKIAPNFIEVGLEHLRQSGCNLFCSNVQIFGALDKEWSPQDYDQYRIRYDNCISQSSMFDRELWRKTGGYKVGFAFVEDWDFWIACSTVGMKVFKSEEKLVYYRSTEDGLHNTFIEDYRDQCMAMLITSNPELYPVEEVLSAQQTVANVPDRLAAKIEKMYSKFPNDALLNFWMGLLTCGRGRDQDAIEFFTKSSQISSNSDWQPLFQLVEIFERNGFHHQTIEVLKQIMIIRPDMTSRVKDKIDRLVDMLGISAEL